MSRWIIGSNTGEIIKRRCAIKWFKHDADASIDAKLQILLLDYGAKGYGLYWYCVELIAQGVNENNITFELEHDARIISRNLNLSIQETKDMMEEMIKLGLFSISQNHKLACYALAKRLDQSMTSNEKMRKLISDIKKNHDPVMTQSILTTDKVMQEEKRREENRLEEKRKEERIFPDWLNLTLWQEWEKHRKEIKKKLTDSTRAKQLIFLEHHKNDHEEIITQSIQNGWTGLFEIKRNAKKTLAERNREVLDQYEQKYSEDIIEGVLE